MSVPKCWVCIALVLILASCQASPAPPTPTIALPTLEVTTASPTARPTPKAMPSQTPTATAEAVTPTSAGADSQFPGSEHFPNPWTQIDKSKITLYPFAFMADYTYDKDGALWIVGSFGVVRRERDNRQTWYSIKNSLSKNSFTTIAIDPHGDVWAGGSDNALFRFDGQQWIDEGDRLPPPYDDRTHYLCYSKDIRAIDFGPDGSVWVVNGGIEVYRRVFGQWINVPFPKEILPIAGGGACPEGIRVRAEDDIVIKIGRC
jgi:hypothetical protein